MVALHYLIMHPDWNRETARATGRAVYPGSKRPRRWRGSIYVDLRGVGSNEDPFVWSVPWLYSYCKATFLVRSPRQSTRVHRGSYLFFVSKEEARSGRLVVDTVFHVADVLQWPKPGKQAPTSLGRRNNPRVWSRHTRFGLGKHRQHTGRFTYTAQPATMWRGDGSFLPLDEAGNRVTVPISSLKKSTAAVVQHGVARSGAFPTKLNNAEAREILRAIWKRAGCAVLPPLIELQGTNTRARQPIC